MASMNVTPVRRDADWEKARAIRTQVFVEEQECPPDEEWDDLLEYALSGGEDGRRVVRPFLADVGRILRPTGRCYLLVSTLTDIEAVVELAETAGLAAEQIAEESFPFERLVVLKITQKNT